MNRVITFYKRFGLASENFLSKFKTTPIMKGVPVWFKQTPGRAQYYYSENLHLIPENILYQIRRPNRIAISEESTKYNKEVETEIIKYLEKRVSHNLFDPEKGLNLDLTVEQARQLLRASEKNFEVASSGELSKILENYNTSRQNVEETRDRIDEQIDALNDKLDAYTKETVKKFKEAGISKMGTAISYVPGLNRYSLKSMITESESALDQDADNADVNEIMQRLYVIAEAKVKVAEAQLDLVNYWTEFNATQVYDKVCFKEAHTSLEDARSVAGLFSKGSKHIGGDNPFEERVNKLFNELLPTYKKNLSEYENAQSRKDSYYSNFVRDDVYDHNPEKFKEDLLAYLSGAIILKDHRYRYQTEQYDRYLAFNRWVPMVNHMTLKQFAEIYARTLRTQVSISHNFLCPQVDANYDDYGKKTVDPISSNVFYFFFSANRMRRKWAQVILSAARYPNEKVRRAYLRFFSNA